MQAALASSTWTAPPSGVARASASTSRGASSVVRSSSSSSTFDAFKAKMRRPSLSCTHLSSGRSVRSERRTRVNGLEVHQEDMRVVDFYELMGVPDDADVKTIKRAYHDLAMYCHPDKSGDDGHDLCVMLNEAYAILKDPITRAMYDAELEVQREDDADEFTGRAYSKWTTRCAKPGETRAVFVDEFTCIGCKQCVWAAPATFRMDDDFGRSRVFAQWLNDEDDIECAIQSCPVDCIHWVEKEQLPYLEHVVRFFDKVSVGIMQSGQGRQMVNDPFDAAYAYQKFRERKIEQRRLRLEEERANREWREAQEAEKEAKEERRAAANRGVREENAEPSFRQRRAYRAAASKVKERWSEGTGVMWEKMKRRRWSDSGSTIPLERSIVLYGADFEDFEVDVREEKEKVAA